MNTTPKTIPAKEVPKLASFKPTISLADVTANWAAKQRKKRTRDDDNDRLKEFQSVATMLCETYRVFSWQDALVLTRSLDIPAGELAPLFNSWIEEMKSSHRIQEQNSCYDWKQWEFK